MTKKEVMNQVISWKTLSLTFSLLTSAYFGLTALFAMSAVQIPGFSNDMFAMLRNVYPMITATTGGVFVALGIGLICGAVCGALLGWLYNALAQLSMNLGTSERWGRLVGGLILLYLGDYIGGIVGGIVFLMGGISVMEAIVGYCYLLHLMKR